MKPSWNQHETINIANTCEKPSLLPFSVPWPLNSTMVRLFSSTLRCFSLRSTGSQFASCTQNTPPPLHVLWPLPGCLWLMDRKLSFDGFTIDRTSSSHQILYVYIYMYTHMYGFHPYLWHWDFHNLAQLDFNLAVYGCSAATGDQCMLIES